MVPVLVDEDLPRSLALYLRESGVDAADVRDVGLAGVTDVRIAEFAAAHGRIALTRDVVFATRLYFEARTGVVLIRFPPVITTQELRAAVRLRWAR